MSNTTGITEVFGELFRTPLEAVTDAEREYLRIWADWIDIQVKLLGNTNPNEATVSTLLKKAPSVQIDGFIDIGITMRIASVSKKEGSISAGLQLGPIHASGAFGFSSAKSQESVFQASARFMMSNHNADLSQYLQERGLIPPTNIDSLKETAEMLRSMKFSKPINQEETKPAGTETD